MTRAAARPGDELVNVVDDHDRVVATVSRRRMRAERLRHRTTMIIVTSNDGRVLVHRRSEEKDIWPGHWDLAAGGVVAAGESYDDAARRELAEELGIAVSLRSLGAAEFSNEDVDLVARMFHAIHDGPFRFADGEVVEARFVHVDTLRRMLVTESFVPDSVALLGQFLDALDARQYDQDVYELEFTVEPFVEGAPGPHVQAAVDAVTGAGAPVDFGPFGSTCRAAIDAIPELVAVLTRAALANGATHVHLHVARVEER